jgi:hypothetical protein
MSENEMNIAIAECCGWTHTKTINNPNETAYGRHPVHTADVTWELPLPNYCGDLNVCQEMIQLLESQGWSCIIIVENNKRCCTFWRRGVEYKVIGNYLPTAICEAFLRTLGKWSE